MVGPVRSNPLLAVIDELLRLQNCFEDLFAEISVAASLSTLQKLVLFSVFDAPVPPTVPQIGRDLGHPRQVIRRIVNELVDDGLLEKAPNPHHRRAMLLVPTDQAEAMKQEAERRAFETATAFLGKFSANRCVGLTDELKALREALEDYVQDKGLAAQSRSAASPTTHDALSLLKSFA